MRTRGGAAAALLLLGQVMATDALARPHRPSPAATAQPARPATTPQSAEARRERVAAELREAARAAGFDPELLLAIARAESSLREHVRNPRSSAAGPLQFCAATWMRVIPRFAARIPELAPHLRRLEDLAARERKLSHSKAAPRDRRRQAATLRREQAAAQRAALALRHDARIAARVAAALAQEDAERFRSLTGERPATPGDIYAVHLLGVAAAADLAKAARKRPDASIAEVLPAGVLRANPEIFTGPDGKPLPVRKVRERIAARLGPARSAAPVQVAEAP